MPNLPVRVLRIVLVISLLLTCLVTVPATHAQVKGALEVSPAIIEVTLDGNKEERVPITFTNHSDEFLSLEIFPIDFKQQDGTGAISFLGQEPGSYSYSLSSFLSFASRTMELGPQAKETLLVTIRDREDLSPGGHYAAVVAKILPDGNKTQTEVAPSVSSLILLRKVGGERFNLSLKDLNFPTSAISLGYPRSMTMLFQNEGNIHLVPYGRVEVRDMTNRLLYKGVINTSSVRVFPSSRRYITADMTKVGRTLPLSINTVYVKGEDSLKKTKYNYQETYIYVSPIFVLLTGVICFGLLGYHMRRRSRRNEPVKQGKKRKGKKK